MSEVLVKRKFKGVWIDRQIWLDKDLTIYEKFLLVEIDSLDNNSSCFASNDYFAEFMDLKKRRIQDIIQSLEKKGYLKRELIFKPGTKLVAKRLLKVVKNSIKVGVQETAPPLMHYNAPPHAVNCMYSNTIIYTSIVKEKLEQNSGLLEICAMQQKITIDQVKSKIEEFAKFCFGIEKKHDNDSDMFRHFGNWLRKQDFTSEATEENVEWFMKVFNGVSKGNFRATENVRKLFSIQLANGFTGDQMKIGIKNMYSSDDRNVYHKSKGYQFATPVHFLKDDNVNRYLNQRF